MYLSTYKEWCREAVALSAQYHNKVSPLRPDLLTKLHKLAHYIQIVIKMYFLVMKAKSFLQRKYAEIVAENPTSFKAVSKPRRARTRENPDGDLVANITNIDTWKVYYDRQDRLEKLRLYFCVVGWQLLTRAFPSHKIFELYSEITSSPEFIRSRLEAEGDLSELSLSMSSMGKIPNYSVLGLNSCQIFEQNLVPKSEPPEE